VKGYPHPDEPERKGLLSLVHNGTLLLDQFGNLPASTRADLLRALHAGEYRRLGEDTVRRSSSRLIAATDPAQSELRPDMAARFEFRIQMPRLEERREDIPLLARHFLCSMLREDHDLSRLFAPNGTPQFDTGFVRKLVRHPWNGHVSELRELLRFAVARSDGDRVQWPDQPLPMHSVSSANRDANEDDPTTRDELELALDANDGSIEKTWRALGLANRDILDRMLTEHGVSPTKPPRK
jgi:DNA-binding NtrC family response regulator